MFELRNLSWPGRFHPLSLSLSAGERVVLLGPNGAGKSSLLQALAGMPDHLSGELVLTGQPLERLSPAEQAVRRAWLPQQVDAPPLLSGKMLLDMGRLPGHRHDEARLEEIIDTLELAPLLNRALGTLSGGERQRLQLGRVLVQSWGLRVTHARALLLDESLNPLDVRHRMRLLAALKAWCATGELCVVWISHDLTLATRWAERLWLMTEGKLVGDGTPQQLVQQDMLSQVFNWPLAWRHCDDQTLLLPVEG